MQKIKFDFEATKERIYAPNSNVPIGAPVDRNGNIANDGNAYGIVLCKETENEKYWVRYNLVVMVAGYCDIIDAQAIWGDEYSAEAIAAMSDIVFCDDHKIGGGGGGSDHVLDNAKSTGGIGWTENETIFDDTIIQTGSQPVTIEQFNVIAGYKYTVIINGTKYENVEAVEEHGMCLLGSVGFVTYPFAIVPNMGAAMFASDGEYNVEITGALSHKISDIYLPRIEKSKEIFFNATTEQLEDAISWYRDGGVLYLAGRLVIGYSGNIETSGQVSFETGKGVYTFYGDGNHVFNPVITIKPNQEDGDASHSAIYLHSNVIGSNKVFEITVNDSGVITATEI